MQIICLLFVILGANLALSANALAVESVKNFESGGWLGLDAAYNRMGKEKAIAGLTVKARINGIEHDLHLDTGSRFTQISNDQVSARLEATGETSPLLTLQGSNKTCEAVTANVEFTLNYGRKGPYWENAKIWRCSKSDSGSQTQVAGFDLLDEKTLRLAFDLGPMMYISANPIIRSDYPTDPLEVRSSKILLPAIVGNQSMFAVFDTGMTVTRFDSKFIESNPDKFQEVPYLKESENGSLSHAVASFAAQSEGVKLYRVTTNLNIGTRRCSRDLKGLYVMPIDLAKMFGSDFSDTKMVLGLDAIQRSNWVLNLKSKSFFCQI